MKQKSSSFALIPKNFAATISNDQGLICEESCNSMSQKCQILADAYTKQVNKSSEMSHLGFIGTGTCSGSENMSSCLWDTEVAGRGKMKWDNFSLWKLDRDIDF